MTVPNNRRGGGTLRPLPLPWWSIPLAVVLLAFSLDFFLRQRNDDGGGSEVFNDNSDTGPSEYVISSDDVGEDRNIPLDGGSLDDGSGVETSDGKISDAVRRSRNGENAVYAVGDLHGDADCALHWVQRTGLVSNLPSSLLVESSMPEFLSREWTWTDLTSTIVFLGDYVDKGPTSFQTLNFVKALTDKFPDNVVAIMGNHELELLKDRDLRRFPHYFFQLPYASVHPGEYLNFISNGERDDVDEMVVDLLLNASLEVYGFNRYRRARVVHDVPTESHDSTSVRPWGMVPIVDFVQPPSMRPLVSDRLKSYQRSYVNAFRSSKSLGRWIENRPVVHLTGDGTLFVHGGINKKIASFLKRGKVDVDNLNADFKQHAHEQSLMDFLEGTEPGQVVEEAVTYRGNHAVFDDDGASCDELRQIIGMMDGVNRIAVGHTPDYDIRSGCRGTFLALDSLLGRWIRATGNNYCPTDYDSTTEEKHSSLSSGTTLSKAAGRTSSNGRYKCQLIGQQCQGQIAKFTPNGEVEIIK